MSLARVVPPGTPGPWALLGGTSGEVPEGFSSIHLAIVIISSTLTGVVACFEPTDELAVELNEILRREEHATMSSDPSGRWVVHYVDHNKRAAVDAMRTGAHRTAIEWMGRHLPGVFARGLLDGDMPTFDLILTDKVEPGPDKLLGRQRGHNWLDLLGLGASSNAWTCQDLPGLSAALPGSLRDVREHHVTLAAKRARLFNDEQLDDAGRDRRALVGRLDTYYLAPLATRWAISGLLSGVERRLARIRDLAEGTSRRGSLRMLGELRRELLAVGLDGHIVAADIVAFSAAAARYDRDVLEFVQARTLRHRNAQHSHAPARMPAALREQQHQRSQRILEVEGQLREVLSATGNLASAISNLRLQLFVAILAVISTAAAIIAVVAAILALNLSQPTTPPPSSPSTSQTTSTSTPTRSSR